MSERKFPSWFIDQIVNEEEKQKAQNGEITSKDVLEFQCPNGHRFTRIVANYISVSTMKQRTECPICKEQRRVLEKAKLRVYPQWFIDELVKEEDKDLAKKGLLKTTDVVQLKCPTCNGIYTTRVGDRVCLSSSLPKYGCMECSKKIRSIKRHKTISDTRIFPDWFIDELVNDDDKKLAKSGMLPSNKKVDFKCSRGHIYNQLVSNHIVMGTKERKAGCPICKDIDSVVRLASIRRKKRFYPDWFINDLCSDIIKEKALSGELTSNESVEFVCEKGHVYTQLVKDHITLSSSKPRYGCPICGKLYKKAPSKPKKPVIKNRTYPQWFIDELVNEEDKIRAINGSLKTTESVVFRCPQGHEFKQLIGNRIVLSTQRKKEKCPICGLKKQVDSFKETIKNKRHSYPQWFIDELVDETDKQRALSKDLSSKDTVLFKCAHGHVYKQKVLDHIVLETGKKKCGCPFCVSGCYRSKIELGIDTFIRSLGFFTEHKRLSCNKDKDLFYGKKYFEIDIYIPEKKIGIEFNGSYYHKSLPKDLKNHYKDYLYHQKKYLACKSLGIRLVSIFEPDWLNKTEKIKIYLRNLLISTENKIYARNTIVRSIKHSEANEMYDKYHLLGKTMIQSISYGLFFNDELVSCMTFQKGRYKEENTSVWCLTRFVTKSGLIVVGGASKLLKQFERDYNPSILVSFSDNDYFSGDVYEKLGFENKGCTKSPRYFWWLEDQEIKREQCQLKKLSKKYPELYAESLTVSGNKEDYIMLKLGAFKVYRSGHTKWVKKYYPSLN